MEFICHSSYAFSKACYKEFLSTHTYPEAASPWSSVRQLGPSLMGSSHLFK